MDIFSISRKAYAEVWHSEHLGGIETNFELQQLLWKTFTFDIKVQNQ